MATLELDPQQIDSLDDSDFAKYITGMLTEKLSLRGYLRFLHLYGPHRGDYTEERHQWSANTTLDEFFEAANHRAAQ